MKIKILISFLSIFLLTGCWNYRELNQLAISTAIAVDKTEDGKYEVSVLISNAKKSQVSSKEGESQTIVYSDTGHTISEAIRNINLQLSRDVYIGHLTVIVINEEIAEEGMYPIMDYFLRDPESVKRFFLIIARDTKAADVIATLSPLEAFPAQNIYFNIKAATNSQAISPSVTYSKFVENIITPGIEPTAPSIIIEGDAKDAQNSDSLQQSIPEAVIKLDTVAIFKDDRLLGYANEKESRGINVINGKVESTSATFEYNDEYITVNVTGINVKHKSVDSLIARLGVELGKELGSKGDVYVKASALNDFGGDADTVLRLGSNLSTITDEIGGTWYEVGIGFNYRTSDATYLYADVIKTYGDEIRMPWQWNVGVRYSF